VPSHIANESEHRRGLVLGLTLAEVLILLLFLILLALGARVLKLESALTKLDPLLAELRKDGGLETIDKGKLVAELARVGELEKSVRDLREENSRIRSELTDKSQRIGALEKFVAAARAIDPNDPPALLTLALEMFEALGLKVDKANWKFLTELSAKVSNAEKSMTAAERERFRAGLLTFDMSGGGKTSGHQWPPIIRISDTDHFFAVGSAELTTDFEERLRTKVMPEVLSISREYDVNVIEVVGHTDEQPIFPRPSNLDKDLIPVLRGEREIETLIAGDNAGLGLIRAVAVVDLLRKDKRFADYRILPLSGAQLIQVDEKLSQGAVKADMRERRRIEIRMRKKSN